MIKDRDAKEGRSAYNVQCCNEDNDLAIEIIIIIAIIIIMIMYHVTL